MKTNATKKNSLILAAGVLFSLSASHSALAQSAPWPYPPPMPSARFSLAAADVNGLVYAIGGWNGCTPSSTLEVYNPANNSWTAEAPMLTPRGYLGAAAVNGVIYAIGGATGCGVYSTANEAYSVS